jgi:hypothetical protein
MSSIQRDSRDFSKYWYACFTTAQGEQRMISTKETDPKKAKIIADQWETAEKVAQ